jgi:hypothetical protein
MFFLLNVMIEYANFERIFNIVSWFCSLLRIAKSYNLFQGQGKSKVKQHFLMVRAAFHGQV